MRELVKTELSKSAENFKAVATKLTSEEKTWLVSLILKLINLLLKRLK